MAQAVPAIFISPTEVKCYTPEMPKGVVEVAVSNNEQDYHGGATFEYVQTRLLRIDPPEGPVAGGTRISIIGECDRSPNCDSHLRPLASPLAAF